MDLLPALRVRDAQEADVISINNLVNSVIQESLTQYEVPQPLEETLSTFTGLQEHGYPCLVATLKEEVIAFGAFTPCEEIVQGYGCEFNCDLVLLVHAQHRRKELGSKLFGALLQHGKTLALRLYVATSEFTLT